MTAEATEFSPAPAPTELTEPFWDGGLSGELTRHEPVSLDD